MRGGKGSLMAKGEELTPFQESLRILMDTLGQIQWAMDDPMTPFKTRNFSVMDENLKKTLCFHVLLLVWVFMEEWKRLEGRAVNTKDDRLEQSLWIIEPAINLIKKCDKGLNRVRNQFLAHPHRDGSKRFVPIRNIFEDPLVPTAFAEMLALGKYVNMATQWLLNLYPSEAKKCTDWLKSQGRVQLSKGVRTLGQANIELKKVNAQIRIRLKSTTLELGNPLTGEPHATNTNQDWT